MCRVNTPKHLTSILALICTALWLFWTPPLWGQTAIAVLDFELNDLTPLPATAEELERTASIRPLLEQALKDQGDYRLVPITAAALTQANVGVGYVYDHPEAAAALGRAHGADWVLVGRLHKPSFLFAYLLGRLVNTATGQVAANLVVEAKGPTEQVTRRAAARLAEQIHRTLGGQTAVPAAAP
ncbi:MAG TPA: DUF2380 domain-containing protein [Lamprocystis sp. (in: g-proteobacteria)]|nr:DUF2380 domain-containing protein [Lamprocystis sp. (in: g-proteobacteria)]